MKFLYSFSYSVTGTLSLSYFSCCLTWLYFISSIPWTQCHPKLKNMKSSGKTHFKDKWPPSFALQKNFLFSLWRSKLHSIQKQSLDRLQHRCFPVKYAKNFRTSFFTEHLRWLLLSIFATLMKKANLLEWFMRNSVPKFTSQK